MKCPRYDREMTMLLTSSSCDVCDAKSDPDGKEKPSSCNSNIGYKVTDAALFKTGSDGKGSVKSLVPGFQFRTNCVKQPSIHDPYRIEDYAVAASGRFADVEIKILSFGFDGYGKRIDSYYAIYLPVDCDWKKFGEMLSRVRQRRKDKTNGP